MKQLFNIAIMNDVQVVSARELHIYLEIDTQFSIWIKRMFEYNFKENKDFILIKNDYNKLSKTNPIDYALTIRTAKEISMLQRTTKGKEAREYFLDIEENSGKQLTQAEILLQSAQMLVNIEQRQNAVEERILKLEASKTVSPDYFTIAGWGTLQKINVNRELAVKLGKRATSICKAQNLLTDKIKDPRFGYVKLYPTEILKQVFDECQNSCKSVGG